MLTIYNIYIIPRILKFLKILRKKKLFSTRTCEFLWRWSCFPGDFFFLPGWRLRLHCLNVNMEIPMCSCIWVSSFQKSSQVVRKDNKWCLHFLLVANPRINQAGSPPLITVLKSDCISPLYPDGHFGDNELK